MTADLHIHTTASDGIVSPEEVVKLVSGANLSVFAITDHDTVAAIPIVLPYAENAGLIFIPGVEINTYWNGEEYHILGYYINWEDLTLIKTLQEMQDNRILRMKKMLDKLQEIGIDIVWKEVLDIAGGESVCRPHLASVLIQKGVVSTLEEAFSLYLGRGQPAYIPRKTILPSKAVELIHKAGGLAVLAHPGKIKEQLSSSHINFLGLDGLEVLHPDHDDVIVSYLKDLAEKEGLLITGGSDFHGFDNKTVGSQPVPLEWVINLSKKKEKIEKIAKKT